jgi:hypothetical protein
LQGAIWDLGTRAQPFHPHLSAPQLIWHVSSSPLHFVSNLLILNHRKIIPFTANPLFFWQKHQTLNQRVQGSSPCAPTNYSMYING